MDSNSELLVGIAAAVTAAIAASTIVMAVSRALQKRRKADPAKEEKARQRGRQLSHIFTRVLLSLLGMGLVWTAYFMVIGLADPAQSEWAANASTLIVSVLTVVSIMIAFFEFLQRGKK